MIKHPAINALSAVLYITSIVLIMSYGLESVEGPDNIVMPIAMLSLFVLSAATMGYIFFSQPVYLYLEGDKKGAFSFFVQTVMIFAVMTVFIFITSILIAII